MWIRKSIRVFGRYELMNTIAVFGRNGAGATSIEYSLIASFIALAIIGSVMLIAPELIPIFDEARDALKSRASV